VRVDELLKDKRDEILKIAAKHGARNVRVFGSVARGQASETSDIDFLVEPGPNTSPWFPVGLIDDLEALLDRKVEVITEGALHLYIRGKILKEAVPL